jgi:SAM-dependent methyltransferase
MRSIIHVLSTELFGASLTLDAFPVKKHLTGIGMSDWGEYARRLSKKFNYRNTFYHKEPRLDITNLYDQELESYDFVISSDVFEHVVPPVGKAFHNLYKIMRPGGVCIFTVPYTLSGTTVEHFPDLFDYVISERENNYYLRNATKAGNEQIFDSLVFHGGPGSTLEMRVFSQQSLLECCHAAGFSSTVIYGEPFFKFGIYWPQPWSLPMALRR